MSILCCIPLYHPNISFVNRLLAQLDSHDVSTLLFANSSLNSCDHLMLPENSFLVQQSANLGTAGAYNHAIDFLLSKGSYSHLLLLDQDSQVGKPYLVFCQEALNAGPPLSNCIFSPYDSKSIPLAPKHGYSTPRSLGAYPLRGITDAKSSGLLIPATVLSQFRFSPQLYVDYVDWSFCWQVRLGGYYICEVRKVSLLEHNLGNAYSCFFGLLRFTLATAPRRRIQTQSAFYLISHPYFFQGAPVSRIIAILMRPFINSILDLLEAIKLLKPCK
jgi:GT2 family glycosyltransferase